MTGRGDIENLLGRYTHAYDLDRFDEMGDYFTEDAEMTMRIADGDLIGPFTGRDAIVSMMRDAHEGQSDTRRHVLSNLVVEGNDDSSARAVSYLTLLSVFEGAVKLLSTGRYEDELVKVSGQWRFSKRHIALDLPY